MRKSMILWKCLHFCEENAASQQNVGTVGLSYFSDIRVKPAAPGPKTPGGDPETGAAQCRSEVVRQRPLGLRVDLIRNRYRTAAPPKWPLRPVPRDGI